MAPFEPAAKGCKVAPAAVFLAKAAVNGIVVGVCKKPGRKRGSTEISLYKNRLASEKLTLLKIENSSKEPYPSELLVKESDPHLPKWPCGISQSSERFQVDHRIVL